MKRGSKNMIKYKSISNLNCPVINCDLCGKKINDYHKGMVKWDSKGDVTFYHKVTCDKKDELPWEEMGTFLLQVFYNTGFKEEVKHMKKKYPMKFPHYVQ